MRFHRHDLRDLKLAFALGFDVRRLLAAGFALCWTLLVVAVVFAALAWRHDGELLSGEGLFFAVESLTATNNLPLRLLWWAIVLGAWFVGFQYLCAPVLRSAAFDIARDERERNPSIPLLNRQAALAPVLGMVLPGACFLVLVLWALLTLIPGLAGEVIAFLMLPPALVFAFVGAAAFLLMAFAMPMMAPAAVTEGRDYFEAATRGLSYAMQQPGRYVGYMLGKCFVTLVSAGVGALVLAIVWGMVALALVVVGQGALIEAVIAEFIGNEAEAPIGTGASLVAVVVLGSVSLYVAWLMVVALAADQIVYLLMRYKVDGVPFSVITVVEEKLALGPTATETEAEAEQARKRHDKQQAEKPAEAG